MRLTRQRPRAQLPVLPLEVARHAAMVDANANGILPAQARTRDAVDAAAAAWAGLLAAPDDALLERELALVDRCGRDRLVRVTVEVAPAGVVPGRWVRR